jgi:hypothetical protein
MILDASIYSLLQRWCNCCAASTTAVTTALANVDGGQHIVIVFIDCIDVAKVKRYASYLD